MSKSFRELMMEDLRLVVLRLLDEAGGDCNIHVLHPALDAAGHQHTSRDALRTQLAWLAEQGLVKLDEPAGVLLVSLTQRGEDAGRGRATVPGVKRPSRED